MIDYIDAHNGGIRMYVGTKNLKGWSMTAKGIEYTLKTCGLAETVMHSSSMDFADEYMVNEGEKVVYPQTPGPASGPG